MKKKILSLVLSGMLAASAVFGLAACKSQNGGNTGNNGGNGNTNNGNGQSIKPGTVITDATLKSSVFAALAEAQPEGLAYSGGLTLSFTQGTETTEQKLSLEGTAHLGKSVAGDLCLSLENEEGLMYLLGFLREDGTYGAMGEAEGKTVDFAALKAQLKAENDPLILEKGEASPAQSVFSTPAVVKMLKNLTSLVDGTVTKTEGGYSLSFDLIKGTSALLDGAKTVAEVIDNTADITLTGLFSQKFFDDTLTSLLKGISAKELSALFPLLPEGWQTTLPEPGNGTAKEYLSELLRSGAFYSSVVGEGEPWTNYRTFGEVPLAEVVSFLTDGETDLASLRLKQMIEDLKGSLENKLVTLLFDSFGFGGTVTGENVDLAVEFSFDDEKKLLGIAIDALAEGNVSENAEQPQPDGGTQPEDGNGDEMSTAAEPAQKVRCTLKLNAACVQAPELFDLSGCKYEGENGTVTIE